MCLQKNEKIFILHLLPDICLLLFVRNSYFDNSVWCRYSHSNCTAALQRCKEPSIMKCTWRLEISRAFAHSVSMVFLMTKSSGKFPVKGTPSPSHFVSHGRQHIIRDRKWCILAHPRLLWGHQDYEGPWRRSKINSSHPQINSASAFIRQRGSCHGEIDDHGPTWMKAEVSNMRKME